MRFVLSPVGSRGDVQPLLALAIALREKGHEVVLCAPPNNAQWAKDHDVEFHPVGRDIQEWANGLGEGVTRSPLKGLRAFNAFLDEEMHEQFEDILAAAKGADAILGAGIQLGAPSAAEKLGIPYTFVAYTPQFFPSLDHAPIIVLSAGLPRFINWIAWKLFGVFYGRLMRRIMNRTRAAGGLPPVDDPFVSFMGPRPFLAADAPLAPLAQMPGDIPVKPVQVGALHYADDTPLGPEVERFLDAGPAPVYVGFGSMPDHDPAATTRAIVDAQRSLSCRIVLSRGWAGLGEGDLPKEILRVGPVNHARLFPRCAVVVHHGGAGTTHAAARAGVPQVVVPHVMDQFHFAHLALQRGIAPRAVARTAFNARRFTLALGEALASAPMRERARALGDALRGADGLAAAVAVLTSPG
jgi:vancomycin aglycone glucosyltransferase